MRRWPLRALVALLVALGVLLVAFHHAPNAHAASPLADTSGDVPMPVGFAGFFVLAALLTGALAVMQRRARRRG